MQEDKMLRELLAITRENNDMLKSINNQRRFNNFYWIFKWIIIVAIAYSAFRAASPYIEQAQNTYSQAQNTLNTLNSLNSQININTKIPDKTFYQFIQNEVNKRIGK